VFFRSAAALFGRAGNVDVDVDVDVEVVVVVSVRFTDTSW
jgi:hypothetical protein